MSESSGAAWAAETWAEKVAHGPLPSIGREESREYLAAYAVRAIAERKLGGKRGGRFVNPTRFWRDVYAWASNKMGDLVIEEARALDALVIEEPAPEERIRHALALLAEAQARGAENPGIANANCEGAVRCLLVAASEIARATGHMPKTSSAIVAALEGVDDECHS